MSAVRYLLATLRAEVEDALTERAEAIAERDRLAGEVETLRARLAAVEALAEKWERDAGETSPAWSVFGPQNVSVPFAVQQIRAALEVTPDA